MSETTFEQILNQLSKPAVRALTNEKIYSVDELYARGRDEYFLCMALVLNLFEPLKK